MSDPIVIWGAGAIGGSLGAAWLRKGHEVLFVDNVPEHVEAINTTGLRIVGPIFEDTVRARAFLPGDLEGKYDRIFLCVKAQHTEGATRELARNLGDDGYVVSAQNGLNEVAIAGIVGARRTIGCFVNFGADYLEPGVVTYSGRGAVVVGEIDGAETDRIKALHKLMQDFDANAVLTSNILGYLWGKLIYGALLFATAVTNDSIADVLDDAGTRPVQVRLAQEVGRVAAATGIRTEAFNGFDPAAFRPDAPQAAIDGSFADMVAHNRRSAKSHSGIWRDLAIRKRKTEAEAQLGPIVDHARKAGHPDATDRAADRDDRRDRGRQAATGEREPDRTCGSDAVKIGFEGRRAIVTGAGHGFGRAIAHAFAAHGARVHALDINAEGLAETVAQADGQCESAVVDVGDRAAVQAAVAGIEADAGGIDILVNNAGGVRGQVGRPIEEISASDWQTIFDVNLSGTFFMTQAVAPAMKKAGKGRVINISSGAGRGISLTGIQAYASAKAGQIGLTRQLAHELGPFGITVNCIAPGFVLSNPTTVKQWQAMGEDGKQALVANIAMRRLGTVADIANAVMFFASDQAGWITGETLGVDGGK